jgi:hypothetical protein
VLLCVCTGASVCMGVCASCVSGGESLGLYGTQAISGSGYMEQVVFVLRLLVASNATSNV